MQQAKREIGNCRECNLRTVAFILRNNIVERENQMQPLNKCTWHVDICECTDDKKEMKVYWWEVKNIIGDNSITRDGISIAPIDNYDSGEAAKNMFREFAALNEIKIFHFEERFRG